MAQMVQAIASVETQSSPVNGISTTIGDIGHRGTVKAAQSEPAIVEIFRAQRM